MTKSTKLPSVLEGPSKLPEDLRGETPERPPNVAKAVGKARAEISASLNAAAVVAAYTRKDDDLEFSCLVRALSDGVREVWSGDMRQAEAMLYGQAHALQAIFMTLARKASRQSLLQHSEVHLRMALKAQNQCRMTLETLATLKNPPVVFARQANINNGGQQQVNNSTPGSSAASPAAKCHPGANEVLEVQLEQRMDPRTPGSAGRTDPHLETVDAVNRPSSHARRVP